MISKITLLRTNYGAKIAVRVGGSEYIQEYDSWNQAVHDIADLEAWIKTHELHSASSSEKVQKNLDSDHGAERFQLG